MKKRLAALFLAALCALIAPVALADIILEPSGYFTFSAGIDGNYHRFTTQKTYDSSGCVLQFTCAHPDHMHDPKITYSVEPGQSFPYSIDIANTSASVSSGTLEQRFDIVLDKPTTLRPGVYPFTIHMTASCGAESAEAAYTVPLTILSASAASQPPTDYGYTMDDVLRYIDYHPFTVYREDDSNLTVWFIQMALTELSYYEQVRSGHYGEHTVDAVKAFQRGHRLPQTGVCDARTMARLFRLYLGNTKAQYAANYRKDSWADVKHLFAAGMDARLIDLWTDLTLDIEITAAENHIDAEPESTADTRALCRMYGANTAREIAANGPRPMLLVLENGEQFVCAATPILDGASKRSNGFGGHLCLYFYGSLANGASAATDVSRAHEDVVRIADNLMGRKQGANTCVGDVARSASTFDNLPPVETPTIILPDGAVAADSSLLKYSEVQTGENAIVYDVHLTNLTGSVLPLEEGASVTLCFPYPEGLDQESAKACSIVINHQVSEERTDVYRSELGEIDFAPQGLCISVSSFSPFEITLSKPASASSLPDTGDSAAPLPALLFLAGASLLALLKKRRAA